MRSPIAPSLSAKPIATVIWRRCSRRREHRGALHALYAFNVEITRVREAAREPLPGEIRLQWWTDVLQRRTARRGEAPIRSRRRCSLRSSATGSRRARLLDFIEARRFDLYDEPMADIADLEAYAKQTSSALFALGGANSCRRRSGPGRRTGRYRRRRDAAFFRHFRSTPRAISSMCRLRLLDRHDVMPQEIFAGQSSPGLNDALAELRDACAPPSRRGSRAHDDAAARGVAGVSAARAVRPSLDRLDRSDAFAPAELSALAPAMADLARVAQSGAHRG